MNVLICDDDPLFALALKEALREHAQTTLAKNTDEALVWLRKRKFDLLLLDIQMRTPQEGLDRLPELRAVDSDIAIVIASGRKDFETLRRALQLGADDYVPKDFEPEELRHILGKVLDARTLKLERQQGSDELKRRDQKHVLVGASPPILTLRKTLDKIRTNSSTVLITGETGTGKEVVARSLRTTRKDGTLCPFVAVDSSTIQGSTAESQLFGHEKGAFTGAEQRRKGIFEEADGGIVYFDEIANMPLEIQSKLLRVLQEKEFTRMGSNQVVPVTFRVVAATNLDLEALSKEGKFKFDLYQRLNVIPVTLPPLRERTDDIPALLDHFLSLERAQTTDGEPLRFTSDAILILKAYTWPGNVRELANLVAYLAVMTEGPEIDVSDLPPKLRDAALSSAKKTGASGVSEAPVSQRFYDQVAQFESEILKQAYQQHASNLSQMALSLGMDRSHLYAKLREYGIHTPKR